MTGNLSIPTRKLDYHICDLPRTSESNLLRLPPYAKFYLHWRRNFQKLILVSVRHPMTANFLRSDAAIAFEKRRHGRSQFWWVIHPCSDLRFLWDFLMNFVFLYLFTMVPYILSFYRIGKNCHSEYWKPVYPAYVICIFDIFFNFITGFVSDDGHEIFLDPMLIIRHYLKMYFWIDLISSIPYTWFYQNSIQPPGPNSNSMLLVPEFLPILKFFRISTLRKYIAQIIAVFTNSHVQEKGTWLILLTLLIFHWSCCLTFAFPYLIMHIKGIPVENSGAYYITTKYYKNPDWKIYLMYLHIGVSNLVGSNFAEFQSLGTMDKSIRSVLLLIGKGYIIYMMVIILQFVDSFAEPELKYQRNIHEVKEYIRDKKLPKHLADKLIAYYDYRFQGNYFKENLISATLSNFLNQEIMIHSSRGLLETATILHNLPRNVIGNLMAVLNPVIYLEEDIIYKCDTEDDCMYFIASGTVALITFYGKEVCHVKDGEYFGVISLMYPDRRRMSSAIALEICELLRLDRCDFKRMFSLTSEFYRRLEKVAKERMEKIKELNSIYHPYSANYIKMKRAQEKE